MEEGVESSGIADVLAKDVQIQSEKGAATINTNLPSGPVAIVKIGQKSVKVEVK